jgi:protein arginine kinase activator
MLCQSCQKFQATLHQLDVVYDDAGRSEVQAKNFCASCAKQAGLPVPKASSYPKIMSMLSKAFLNPLQNAAEANAAGAPAQPAPRQESAEGELPSCPDCGWTLRDLKQTSRLGCPKDYEIFADYLGEMFERLHGFDSHVDLSQDEHPLERIQAAMEKAIVAEDYEKAAELRDRLQALQETEDGLTAQDQDWQA